jgi:ABC-type sugar transport system permease subunit
MEKRVVFKKSRWLPWVLVAPQTGDHDRLLLLAGGQALWFAFLRQDAFGTECRVRRLENFTTCFNDRPTSSRSRSRPCSRCWWPAAASSSLLLAVMADRVVRGALVYRTLLIWPYAVAPAVAGVLWGCSCSRRRSASSPSRSSAVRHRLELGLLKGDQAMLLVVIASIWKQISYNFLFFLAGLQSIPKVADRGRGHRRRAAPPALLDHRLPAAVADHLLPARGQHRLRLLRHLRRHRRDHRGRPGGATEILVYKVYTTASRRPTWAARRRSR